MTMSNPANYQKWGFASLVNTTSTPLANGAIFTGVWESVAEYPSICVALLTDTSCSLAVQFSSNASNADSTLTFAVAASTNEVHRITVTRRYFRIVITNNSGGAQTYLRAQALVGFQTTLNSPFNSSVALDADTIVVRSVPQTLDLASGRFVGYSVVNKFGKNSDIDTGSTPEDIWEGGGLYTGFPSGNAETISVFSDSANDASGGSGARTVRMIGLDTNFNQVEETVTLNGVTPVVTTQTFKRLHTASVLTSGSSNAAFNAGTITFRHTTTTANVFLVMAVGRNQTNCSAYTIPAGKTGYLQRVTSSILRGGATASVDAQLYIRANGASPRLRRPFSVSNTAGYADDIYGGLSMAEKTDIVLRVTTASANNLDVTGGYDLILVDN